MIVAMYRVLYGLDFIRESIQSIYDSVDRIVVFWTDKPWGGVSSVMYKGEHIVFPDRIEAIEATLAAHKALFDTQGKIELCKKHFNSPRNQHQEMLRLLGDWQGIPCYAMHIEPDCVMAESELERAIDSLDESPYHFVPQVELWKNRWWRIPHRDRSAVGFYNMETYSPNDTLPNGRPVGIAPRETKGLVHNLGFCVRPETMYWKHLTALAFSPMIGDSIPSESWLEEKWLPWSEDNQLKNLEIAQGRGSDIPRAIPNDKGVPECLEGRL